MFHHENNYNALENREFEEKNGCSSRPGVMKGRMSLATALFVQVITVMMVFAVIAYTRAGYGIATEESDEAEQNSLRSGSKLGEIQSGNVPYIVGKTKLSSMKEMEKKALFEEFKSQFAREYLDEEDEGTRYGYFEKNLKIIDLMNEGNEGTAQYGITRFADFSEDELKQIRGYKAEQEAEEFEVFESAIISTDIYNEHLAGFQNWDSEMCGACDKFPEMATMTTNTLPTSFDWRDWGAVTKVRNQYICGDCWAFAVTDTVASQEYFYGQELQSRSAQQLTSCDAFCWGCDGGWFVGAYREVFKTSLRTDLEYPFASRDGVTQKCRKDILENTDSDSVIKGWTKVKVPNADSDVIEETMKLALMKNGPMAVAIDATSQLFYTSGIDPATKCSTTDLDHAVLLVGWGVEDGTEFWIVKNSWGDIWGEDGYWRVVYGKNACGITEYVMATF